MQRYNAKHVIWQLLNSKLMPAASEMGTVMLPLQGDSEPTQLPEYHGSLLSPLGSLSKRARGIGIEATSVGESSIVQKLDRNSTLVPSYASSEVAVA